MPSAGPYASATDARLITGYPQSGAEKLPGRGSFLLVTGGGEAQPFTAPLVEEQDLAGLLAEVQAKVTYPELHSEAVADFIAALERKSGTGRPAKEIEPAVMKWLVARLEAGDPPSHREIQRYIAQAEASGAALASRPRAVAALKLAEELVAP